MPYDVDDGRWHGLRICITSFDGKYKCCLFLNMMYQICGMSNIQLLQKDISKNLRMLSEIMSFGFFCKVLLTTKKSPISTLFFFCVERNRELADICWSSSIRLRSRCRFHHICCCCWVFWVWFPARLKSKYDIPTKKINFRKEKQIIKKKQTNKHTIAQQRTITIGEGS